MISDFSKKKIGFYVGSVAALLSLVCAFVYLIGFNQTDAMKPFFTDVVWVLLIIAFVCFAVMSVFKETENLAAVVLGVLSFIALLAFIMQGYMYFSEIFYGEISIAVFFEMNFAYLFSILSLLFILITSNIAVYLGQKKDETKGEVNV